MVGGGLLTFAFAFEPEEYDVMKPRHNGGRKRQIFTRQMWFLIFIVGIATDLVLFGLFVYLQRNGYELAHIRTLMFLGLAIDSIFFGYSLRSLRRPLWKISLLGNPFFWLALAINVSLLMLVFLFESLSSILSLVSISAFDLFIITLFGISNLLLIEAGKWWFIRRGNVE